MTSQAELDRILTTWLADGPKRAPEDRLRTALADVAGTPQKRVPRVPSLVRPRARSGSPAALYALIAVAVLTVISLGLGFGTGLIRLPTPTQPPAPAPSGAPDSDASRRGLIGYRYREAGFEIALPDEWLVTSGPDDPALTARSEASHLRLFIASGDSTGRLRTCRRPAGPWESCGPHVARDRASLGEAIGIRPVDDHGVGPPTARLSHVKLGGEPATLQSVVAYEYPAQGGQAVSWVVAMHHERPFVVRFSWSVGREVPDVLSILSTFRFLDERAADGAEVNYRDPGGAYALTIPPDWEPTSVGTSGFQSFTAPVGDGRETVLQVRSSMPDGTIELCADSCATFDDVASLEELSAARHNWRLYRSFETGHGPRLDRVPDVLIRDNTTLGGVTAVIERPGVASSQDVYAVHDGVAVVLSFETDALAFDEHTIDQILAGFRFLDESSPDAWQALGFGLFTNSRDGYEVALPSEWSSDPPELAAGESSVAFGSGRGAGTHGSPALRITVGEPDGTIHLCGTCTATVRSLDEFEELLLSTPSFFTTGPDEQHGDLVVAGDPARSESAGIGNNCLGCPSAYHHVYFIHDGRPVVLAFDYWTVRFGSMVVRPGHEVPFTREMLDAILSSFRFVDRVDATDAPSPSSGGYRVTIPGDWTEVDAPADGVREFAMAGGGRTGPALRIAFERPDGILNLCMVRCVTFGSIQSLGDLGRAIHDPAMRLSPIDSPYGPVTPEYPFLVRRDTVLDGERAIMERPDPIGGGWSFAGVDEHVFAVHGGRAVVISFDYEAIRRGSISEEQIAGILDSFEFTDE